MTPLALATLATLVGFIIGATAVWWGIVRPVKRERDEAVADMRSVQAEGVDHKMLLASRGRHITELKATIVALTAKVAAFDQVQLGWGRAFHDLRTQLAAATQRAEIAEAHLVGATTRAQRYEDWYNAMAGRHAAAELDLMRVENERDAALARLRRPKRVGGHRGERP